MESCSLCSVFLVVTAITLLISWIFKPGSKTGKHLKVIPGPKGLPIIGNIHQMSKVQTHQLTKWSEEFGEIYKLNLGGQEMIIVSNSKLSKEIFNNPALVGKPFLSAFTLHKNQKPALGILNSDGEVWEVHRRFLLRQLREFGFGKSSMEQLIVEELDELLETLGKKAGSSITRLDNVFRLPVVNSLWKILTSERFNQNDTELLALATETINAFNEAMSGSGLLMFFPFLRKIIPKLSGYQKLRTVLDTILKVFGAPVEEHKKSFEDGHFRDFIDVYLSEMKKTSDNKSPYFHGELGERQLVSLLFDVFFAGSDTNINTLTWTMLYACKHPEAQVKLQNEIQTVTDENSRRVVLSDRKSMPYTQSFIDEVLRHSSVIADGVPHRAVTDVEIGGYFIPKNAWVQPNLFNMHHDPKIWKDPDNFRPERFLSESDDVDDQGGQPKLKYEKSEHIQPFQVGKRVCVGETLARDTLFLFITNIFQKFTVKFDPDFKEPSEFESLPGFFRSPTPFNVIMQNRK